MADYLSKIKLNGTTYDIKDITARNSIENLATVASTGNYSDLTGVPTNVSSFSNDAGYLTSFTETDPTVPSWAKAESKPTYTASEVGAAATNHSHDKLQTTAGDNNTEYNLIGTATTNTNTSAVSIYQPTLISFSKYADNFARLTLGSSSTPAQLRLYSSATSASGYTDLKSGSTGTKTQTITFPDATGTVALTSDIPNVSSWALAANKPSYTFAELTSHPTTIANYGITDAYTKTEVDGMVSGVLHYKGTKATVSALPSSGNVTGDVWHVTADGGEYAWDGSTWQELGSTVDLSGYVPTSRTINGKALTGNISLSASDVSALPSNTTYVSSFNGSTGAITYTAPVTSVNGQTGAVTVTTAVTQTLTSGTAIGSVAGTTLYAPAAYDDTALAARVTALEQIPWVTYYTGSNAPSNSQGTNGDLYFQTSE